MATAQEDSDFIIAHAERIVKVAAMCVISFGLTEGLNDLLIADAKPSDDTAQALAGFQDGTMLIAVLRASLLLDRDEKMVSFQSIYHRLKKPTVCVALKNSLAKNYGHDDLFPPSRDQLISEFINVYGEIDWEAHGRLTHLRNVGVAHLTVTRLQKSITYDELRNIVSIIARMTLLLQHLCQTETAFHESTMREYQLIARKAFN